MESKIEGLKKIVGGLFKAGEKALSTARNPALLLCISLVLLLPAASAVPEIFNVQGRLTDDNNVVVTGSYDFVFYIYNDLSNGDLLWSEEHDDQAVINGLFNVTIGDVNTNKSFNEIDFNTIKWLEIEVETETQAPRLQMASIGTAMRAQIANDLNSTSSIQADLNTFYSQIIDTNNPSRLSYSVLADLNEHYYGITDSNNPSRLLYSVIADNPYIPTEADIDGNAISVDTNYMTTADFNSQYCSIFDSNNPSRLGYTVIADPPWGADGLPDTTIDTNQTAFDSIQTDMNLFYNKLLDSNDASRLGYTVIADPPWTVGTILADTTIDTNTTAYISIQADLNTFYNRLLDSNNASRLQYSVIADNPYIPTEADIDANAIAIDTNYMTDITDFNAQYCSIYDSNNASRLTYTVIADAPWAIGTILADTTIDTNATAYTSVQADLNTFYNKLLDSNNVSRLGYTVIADAPWVTGTILPDTTIDTNQTAFDSIQTDMNLFYNKLLDSNDASRLSYAVIDDPQQWFYKYDTNTSDVNGEDLRINKLDVDSNASFWDDANFVRVGIGNAFIDGSLVMNPTTGSTFQISQIDGNWVIDAEVEDGDDTGLIFRVGAEEIIRIGNAAGNYSSTTIGGSSIATGDDSIAMGWNTVASGDQSLATGSETIASGQLSTAMGFITTASGIGSFAVGTVDSGPGRKITAGGEGSIAMGYSDANHFAGEKGSVALGYNCIAKGEASICLGKDLTNFNPNSVLVQDLNALGDANINSITATYFGDASGVTGILTYADANKHYVPYIGADYDLNLGGYGLKAFGDSNLSNAGISGNLFLGGDFVKPHSSLSTFSIYEETAGGFEGWAIDAEVEETDDTCFSIKTGEDYHFIMGDCADGGTYNSLNIGAGTANAIITLYGSHILPKSNATQELGLPHRRWENVCTVDLNASGDINAVGSIQASYFFGDGSALTEITATSGWPADTTIDTNQTAFDSIQTDLNLFYCIYSDQNNTSRLSYTVIADAPWTVGGVAWADLATLFPVPDANVADAITVNWTGLDTYPEACTAGQYVTTVGDTLTCSLPDTNGFDVTFNAVAVDNNLSVSGITSLRDDLNVSAGVNQGVSIEADVNRVWIGSMYIDYNGTAMVIGG